MNTSTSIHQEAELWAASAAMGGLAESELKEWNDHLATCRECRKLNDEEAALCSLIKGKLDAECPDPGFEQRIINGLRLSRASAESRWPGVSFFPFGLLAAAACIALLGIAGWDFLMHERKPDSGGTAASGWPGQPSMGDLPAVVRAAVEAEAVGKTVTGIQRDDDDGDISYEIGTRSKDGAESGFTVGADGTLQSVEMTLADAPEPVREAINAQLGQSDLAGVEEDFDGGNASYVATITAPDGHDHDFTFAKDGTLQEIETTLAELPPALQAAVKAQAAQGRIEDIEKTFDDGDLSYVATITLPDGRERDFTFDPDGTLASVEVTLAELPAPLRAAIKDQAGQNTIESIDKTFDDGAVSYDATVTMPDGQERDFSLSEQGALLSREVAMAEAPAAVQQTISHTLGNGKVVEIDQAFDAGMSSVPYEIEGWKDGKPFYFLVSPTGDFLGMED